MSMLVHEELITKGDRQIKRLQEGLKELEIYDIVKSNTEMLRTYFVYSKCEISAQQLLSLVEIEEPKGKGQIHPIKLPKCFSNSVQVSVWYH